MSAMLYQVSLFRVFQQVFESPRDTRYDELRRLGIYVFRQFVKVAPTNPKIYAELFFHKTVREANEIEMGYGADIHDGKNKAWTEEQEEELRQLFHENQTNPSTEQDVIDWMVDNLIEKNRTRRAVIKKLKELGLIFKAPTRKSLAAGASKHAWHPEHDKRLRELYDSHREDPDCLNHIMEEFAATRSRNSVIKRMIEIDLIADRSEILPSKRKRAAKSAGGHTDDNESANDSDSDSDNEIADLRPVKITKKIIKLKEKKKERVNKSIREMPKKSSLNVAEIRRLIGELDDEVKTALEWIQESLTDAAEDAEDPSEDPDDGVPLVPFTAVQRAAFDSEPFKQLMLAFGFQEPLKEMETYWRIPVNMTAQEMRQRVKILENGEIDESELNDNEDDFEKLQVTDSEDEDEHESNGDENHRDYRSKVNNLIYNDSDSDEANQTVVERPTPRKASAKSTATDIFDMVKNIEGDEDEVQFDSEDIRGRLAQLVDSDNSDDDVNVTAKKRVLVQLNDSDSEGEANKKSGGKETYDINSQDVRSRLAELEDSDESDVEQPKKVTKKSKRIIESDDSDVENDQLNVNASKEMTRRSNKRERSVSDDEEHENPSDKVADISVAKKRKSTQIIDSDDDDQ